MPPDCNVLAEVLVSLKPRKKMKLSLGLWTNSVPVVKFINRSLFTLTFVLVNFCVLHSAHEERIENYLLCKFCGADAADLEYATTIHSPVSLKSENQSLSGKQVFMQTLKNPAGVYFDIITVKKSNCIGVGEWKKSDTWFPGFAWKACTCQPWGHFLGWIFEPFDNINDNKKQASEKGFYALIYDHILTEQFSNSLLIVPKSFKS